MMDEKRNCAGRSPYRPALFCVPGGSRAVALDKLLLPGKDGSAIVAKFDLHGWTYCIPTQLSFRTAPAPTGAVQLFRAYSSGWHRTTGMRGVAGTYIMLQGALPAR